MIGYRLKYGFISNYNETVFLYLDLDDSGEPCIYYSNVIKATDIIDKTENTISVRLAFLWLIYITCSPSNPNSWSITGDVAKKMARWITKLPSAPQDLSTPYGARINSFADYQHPGLCLESPRASRTLNPMRPPWLSARLGKTTGPRDGFASTLNGSPQARRPAVPTTLRALDAPEPPQMRRLRSHTLAEAAKKLAM
jgi:hypothetical protein